MKPKDNLSLGLLLYGYAVFLGAIYIFAFWRPYGFNVFPYLSTSDFITAPLNRIWVLLAPLVLLLTIPISEAPNKPRWPFSVFVVAFALHIAVSLASILESFQSFSRANFSFENEKSILVLCVAFLVLAAILAYCAIRNRVAIGFQILAFIFAQTSVVMAIGYNDGKGIFNGASNVHFLENRELCETPPLRDWVYVEKFGSHAFFLNTIDKRLCIVDKLRFNLVSRKYSEGL